MSDKLHVYLVGCGVIGERRLENLPSNTQVVAVCDPQIARAQKLAEKMKQAGHPSQSYQSLEAALVRCPPKSKNDFAIVATINSELKAQSETALTGGLHVLVEKPAARHLTELQSLKNPLNKLIKVGFNHRFHPAFREIQKRLSADTNDPLMYITASYGNGARVGFDKEWRANPELSGGGELLDQGVHVLDLASQILPELKVKSAHVRTHYWNMPVDDNAWAILENSLGQTFSMHVSSSEWKNEFRFAVYTRKRKFLWTGLGRSYGAETLHVYTMKPEMGPPLEEKIVFDGPDHSWFLENTNFVESILGQATLDGSREDAEQVLSLVADIYRR